MLSTLYILTLSPALHDDDKKQTLKIEIEPAIVCFVAAAQQKKTQFSVKHASFIVTKWHKLSRLARELIDLARIVIKLKNSPNKIRISLKNFSPKIRSES